MILQSTKMDIKHVRCSDILTYNFITFLITFLMTKIAKRFRNEHKIVVMLHAM